MSLIKILKTKIIRMEDSNDGMLYEDFIGDLNNFLKCIDQKDIVNLDVKTEKTGAMVDGYGREHILLLNYIAIIVYREEVEGI